MLFYIFVWKSEICILEIQFAHKIFLPKEWPQQLKTLHFEMQVYDRCIVPSPLLTKNMPLRNWFVCEQTYCTAPIFNRTSISCKVISFILIKKVISLVAFLVLAFIGQLFDIFPLTELFAALNSVTLQWSILPHFQAYHLHFREHAIILKEASRLLYFSFKFSQN